MKWINVEYGFPPEYENVLCWEKEITIGFYHNGIWTTLCADRTETIMDSDEVTHWMPLPKPPEDDE